MGYSAGKITAFRSAICAGLAALLLASCSDKPGASDVTGQVRKQLLSEPIAHVDALKQVNGFKKDDNHYVAVVQYHITFLQSLDDLTKSQIRGSKDLGEGIVAGFSMFVLRIKFGEFKKGDSFDVESNYLFLKTDNGWILQGIDQG